VCIRFCIAAVSGLLILGIVTAGPAEAATSDKKSCPWVLDFKDRDNNTKTKDNFIKIETWNSIEKCRSAVVNWWKKRRADKMAATFDIEFDAKCSPLAYRCTSLETTTTIDLGSVFDDLPVGELKISNVLLGRNQSLRLPNKVEKSVRIQNARIDSITADEASIGELDISNARLNKLEIANSYIKRDFALDNITPFDGKVAGGSLILDRTTIGGDLIFSPIAIDEIEIIDSKIVGLADIGAIPIKVLTNRNARCEILCGDQIEQPISGHCVEPPQISFQNTSVGTYTYHADFMRDRLVELSNFEFSDLRAGIDPTVHDQAIETIINKFACAQQTGGNPDRANYEALFHLASEMENIGRFNLARTAKIKAEEGYDRTLSFSEDPLLWIQRKVGGLVAGYGHNPLKAVVYFFLMAGFGTFVTFGSADRFFAMSIPRDSRDLPRYLLRRFWYSVEMALPLISLATKHESLNHDNIYVDSYFHLHKIFGAFLTAVFAVALTV